MRTDKKLDEFVRPRIQPAVRSVAQCMWDAGTAHILRGHEALATTEVLVSFPWESMIPAAAVPGAR
jgi:hypothetical protein